MKNTCRKTLVGFSGIMLSLSIFFSCKKDSNEAIFTDFPVTLEMKGTVVEFPDSFINSIGSLVAVEDGYWCSIYDSDDCLLVADSMFRPIRTFAHKGQGPGEITGKSSDYGRIISGDGLAQVYDPNTHVLYGTNSANDYKLKKIADFNNDSLKRYPPVKVTLLDNGNYVMEKDDFSYGLIEFNPRDSSVKKWPVGYEFEDMDKPDMKFTDMHFIAYNPENGVVAEGYDRIPTVILHDETGNIIRKITYGGYEYLGREAEAPSCYNDIKLTDKHILLMYSSDTDRKKATIFALDYEGNPVVEMRFPYFSTFTVDSIRNRIITVDPNNEDEMIIVYDLPEILR